MVTGDSTVSSLKLPILSANYKRFTSWVPRQRSGTPHLSTGDTEWFLCCAVGEGLALTRIGSVTWELGVVCLSGPKIEDRIAAVMAGVTPGDSEE